MVRFPDFKRLTVKPPLRFECGYRRPLSVSLSGQLYIRPIAFCSRFARMDGVYNDTTLTFMEITMRILLTLSILTLVFCVGCTQSVVHPENLQPVALEDKETGCSACSLHAAIQEKEAANDAPASDAAPPAETGTNSIENGTIEEPTAAVTSSAQAKYAAESVPLPPIADLTAQIDDYMTRIGEALERLDGSPRYEDDAATVVRDVSALATIALAIGLAEEDSKYKQSASHIIVSARALAAAKTLEDGNKAFAALQASLTDTSEGAPLAWTDKVADLGPLMKSLPNLSSAVNRLTNTENRFSTVAAGANARTQAARTQVLGHLAALAAISQGSIPNAVQTEKPDAVAEWKKYCEDFRDAAIKVNAAAHQFIGSTGNANYTLYDTAFKAMAASCDDCHRTFYPNAVGQTE